MAWIYILKCTDGFYYVGNTRDTDLRMDQHASGGGGNHTRKRLQEEARGREGIGLGLARPTPSRIVVSAIATISPIIVDGHDELSVRLAQTVHAASIEFASFFSSDFSLLPVLRR